MNTYILVFLLICNALVCKAQYKTMFSSDSITWVQTVEISDGTTDCNYTYSGEKFSFQGKDYFRFNDNPCQYNNTIHGIREDLVNGKTWLLNINMRYDTVETLIMDLNLEIGDWIPYNFFSYSKIDSVEVVKIDTHNERKVIEFETKLANSLDVIPLKYIEGIGPNYGPILPDPFGFANQILCKLYSKDLLIYALDTTNLSCPFFTAINDELEPKIKIMAYPNPVSSLFNISIDKSFNLNGNIDFYNIYGNLLFSRDISGQTNEFDLSEISPQIIIFKITSQNFGTVGKILKK